MIRIIFGAALFLCLLVPLSRGNESMILDVETLRNSLSENDSARKELTLRLADLYFFTAINLEKKARLVAEGMDALDKKALKFRRRALSLYREAKRKYKLGDETGIKVNFQLARTLEQLGNNKSALSLWEGLRKQEQMVNIRREAVLKLAENAEENNSLGRAESLYKEALKLCEDACGFVRYRLGWVYRNLGKIELALDEMKAALWDKKGQAQEEVLRDYIAVLSQKAGNGSKAIEIVESLSRKTGRSDLLEKLAYGFYAAGNKVAGSRTLAIVTERNPTLKNQIQLLEEYYGLREWSKFRELRERIRVDSISSLSKKDAGSIENIMRRLVVQLEAEQKQNPAVLDTFLTSSLLYLELFPSSDVVFKVMRSWIRLEKNNLAKMERTGDWISDSQRFRLASKEIVELREERARLAQKEKKYDIMRQEMGHLSKTYKDRKKREKAKYVVAHSYYKENLLEKALPLFIELAQADGTTPSKWSIQAQNLVLDIFNQKKDYDGLIRQADSWLKQEWENLSVVKKDLKDIRRVREQAEFEKAVADGESEDALKIFFKYCQGKKLLPQSCDNAKKLSIALKNQSKLISILKINNDKEALMNEYEISGHYAKAAKILAEKSPLKKGKWSFEQAIKIALLYELEGNFKKRDAWLNGIVKRYTKKKVPAKGETLFFTALKDAGKLGTRHISVKWSKNIKRRLVKFLEENGKGNKTTRKLFLAEKKSQGKLWEYYHLQNIYKLADQEQNTKFYGKRSKIQFQRRLARIKKLDKYANRILNQLTPNAQTNVVGVLHTSYNKFNQEIIETPIPEGLNDEALAQVKNSLITMARPFGDKSESYRKLLETELEKRGESFDADGSKKIYVAKDLLANLQKPELEKKTVTINLAEVFPLLRKLNDNPLSYETVDSLKKLYLDRGKNRLASYYEGRLENLRKVQNENI